MAGMRAYEIQNTISSLFSRDVAGVHLSRAVEVQQLVENLFALSEAIDFTHVQNFIDQTNPPQIRALDLIDHIADGIAFFALMNHFINQGAISDIPPAEPSRKRKRDEDASNH